MNEIFNIFESSKHSYFQMAAGILFMYIVFRDSSDTEVMPYCLITSLSAPVLVLGPITFLLILQIIAVITFEVLMRINKVSSKNRINGHY